MISGSSDWISRFPALTALPQEDISQLKEAAQPVSVPAGTVLFTPGVEAGAYVLVLSGSVKVSMPSESGREIVLYRVEAGEPCVLTTACLLASEAYGAEGVAETAVSAVMVPVSSFNALVARSEPFRQFVFGAYGHRITDLLLLVREVAFRRMDSRLARLLVDRATSAVWKGTHQDLATELGTVREVVSRTLKEFERKGFVELTRGRIDLKDIDGLEKLADLVT